MERWLFYDPQLGDTYTFTVNPNDGGSPQYQKTVGYQPTAAPDGALLAYEGRDQATTAEFSGSILYRQQYDAMIEWFNKRYPIEVTDDLDRILTIYITTFEPKRVRSATYPWKHTYSVKYLVLGVEMPALLPADLALASSTLRVG
jgi:hypothetical protein